MTDASVFPGSETHEPTVLARRDAGGSPVVVVLDRHEAGEAVDWAALVARPSHRVIFRRGRTAAGADAREVAVAAALVAIEGPGAKHLALDLGDRRLSMRERSEGRRRLDQIADDPAGADFVAACGRCAMAIRRMDRPLGPLLALYDACGREPVDEFFERWPFLLRVCESRAQGGADGVAGVARAILSDERDLAESLAGIVLPGRDDRDEAQRVRETAAMRLLLRRLRGAAVPLLIDAEAMLWLASRMPPDWIPDTGDRAALFSFIAKTVRSFCIESEGALSAATLIASSKGRWSEFVQRMDGRHDVRQAADMWQAFCNQVARPSLRHHLPAGALPLGPDPDAPEEESEEDRALRRYCAGLLFGAKSLPAVLEIAEEWHDSRSEMDLAIGGGVRSAWPVPFARVEEAGVVLVAVADSEDLEAEGAALRHCVGGYVDRCLAQDSVIVSIRRRLDDGGEVRSSTAELSGWRFGRRWLPSVMQHRGVRNSDPSGEDVVALAAFVDRLRAGNTVVLPDPSTPADAAASTGESGVAFDAVSAAARYDWRDGAKLEAAFRQWVRFLPAQVAARGPRWFADHAADIADPPREGGR